jgi:hypothetical protein
MRVLIGCEFGGRVRDAFIKAGHDAMSCDLLETEVPGPHYKGDVNDLLNDSESWDLIIMHPPCTALAVSGNGTYGEGKDKHHERIEAARWTQELWDRAINCAPRVVFENPIGVLGRLTDMPKPQYVQPWQFGHMETKKTGLYLHGVAPLLETDNVFEAMMRLPVKERMKMFYLPPSIDRWKLRSLTYQGLADAMASQWGALCH